MAILVLLLLVLFPICLHVRDYLTHFLYNADATAYSRSHFGQGNGSLVLDNTCVGNESRLVDCQYTVVSNCSLNQDAGISCKDECEFNCVLPSFSTRCHGYRQ